MVWHKVCEGIMIWSKRISLNEAEETDDIHIYVDDNTGDYYYFDGEHLIKLGGKPEVGSKGNKDIQDEEDKKRDAQIQKEKEERENDPDIAESDAELDDYGDGYSSDDKDEAARAKELQDTFDSVKDNIKRDIDQRQEEKNSGDKKDKDKGAKINKKELPPQGLEDFKLVLKKFIQRELANKPEKTYARLNKTYAGSGIIRPGMKRYGDKKIPSLYVYFDQSGSWGESDVKVGLQALASLNKYVEEKKINLKLFYFANHVSETNPHGGGTNCPEVVEHIIKNRPDNVLIMTDSDGQGEYYPTPAIVPGAVWFLWRKRSAPDFKNNVIGKKENRQFMI